MEPDASKPRRHSICSAHAAERWLNCPGSVYLSRTVPPAPSSSYAEEGTRAHVLGEKMLRKALAAPPPEHELEVSWLEEQQEAYADTRVPEGRSMVDHVQTYVRACVDELKAFVQKPTWRVEQTLVLDKDKDMFGTLDFFATGMRESVPTGVIVDLKYGTGVRVKAEGNPQLAYYACALRKNSKKGLKAVKVVVVQPRTKVKQKITSITYNEQELQEWETKLVQGADDALWQLIIKQPVLKKGKWCWFCPARGVCTEYSKGSGPSAAEEFPDDL